VPVISATQRAPAIIVIRRISFPSRGIVAGIILIPTDLAGVADSASLAIRQAAATRRATIVSWNKFPLAVFVRVARYAGLSDAVRCAATIFMRNFRPKRRKKRADHPGPVKGARRMRHFGRNSGAGAVL
jgi:hypothetical protein